MSLTDGLTKVSNRKFFDQRLLEEWKKGSRQTEMLSLIMIDGDHFKNINDNYGHLCGDAILKHLAELFQSCLCRSGDVVARYGGEEFAVILSNTDVQGAAIVAERIRKKVMETPLSWEGNVIPMTISVGVASLIPDMDNDLNSLIHAADQALYKAKESGRNCVVVSPAENSSKEDAIRHGV